MTRLAADGGTAIGPWLAPGQPALRHQPRRGEARDHAHRRPRPARDAASTLLGVLAACEGRFVCDSRGIGNDWVADELRLVASTLLGTADGLEDPAELPAAFAAMTEAAMGKAIADVSLRLWTPAGADDPVRQAGVPAGRGPDRAAHAR